MSYNTLPTIKNGSVGLSVAYCQNLLNARLATQPCLWVDGIFGMKTDARVRQYQMMKRLQVDGVVGGETWKSLEEGPPRIVKRPSPGLTDSQIPATAGF